MSRRPPQPLSQHSSCIKLDQDASVSKTMVSMTPLTAMLNRVYSQKCAVRNVSRGTTGPESKKSASNSSAVAPTPSLGSKTVTSEDVLKAIDQLSITFQDIKKSSDLTAKSVSQTKPLSSITANDLNALPQSGQAAAAVDVTQENDSSTNLDNFEFTGKTMQEKVAELRAKPEILKKIIADCNNEKAKAVLAKRTKNLEDRIAHRAFLSRMEQGTVPQSNPRCYTDSLQHRHLFTPYAASYKTTGDRVTTSGNIPTELSASLNQKIRTCLASSTPKAAGASGSALEIGSYQDTQLFSTAVPPLIPDIVKHNRLLSRTDYYTPEVAALRNEYRGLRENIKMEMVLNNYDAVTMKEYERSSSAYRNKLQNAPGIILPQTFIIQRNKLCPLIYLAARFAALFEVSKLYSEINLNNALMSKAAITIQYVFRAYAARRNLERMRQAATTIQLASLRFLNSLRLQRRRASLLVIKRYLMDTYRQNTWMAATYMHYHGAATIVQWLRFHLKRKNARLEYIRASLRLYDWIVTKELLGQKKVKAAEAFMRAESKKKTKRDPTTGKKILPVAPSTAVNDEEIGVAVFQPDIINMLSRILYNHIARVNAGQLDKIHEYILGPCRGYCGACMSFIPGEECLLEVIRCAKGIHGTEGSTMGDLQAAINGLLLDNPQYVEKVVLDENFGHVKVSIVNGAIVEVNEDEE
ncbi:hypothetical protein GL50803_0016668 [Giardia duodenalis]|uniref:Uncharacterized protein n=1 Tax=Giardia intestinalis (strain ATCC 50803 / WB clone C6) TaxID=184922 RepID=A8B4I2_GIAIC|nr:hypothetical protein GL50803_0016668 [Giardia intestinalis]KAE8303694.1 hypothetical protein GL50803_0016668 [Giardia intestinalis]|eukprot:XP_001709604.1 Hypothetical protein GL50803_16668 [Giardia lamblia ATCC 50803]